jgi:hypothetical protein
MPNNTNVIFSTSYVLQDQVTTATLVSRPQVNILFQAMQVIVDGYFLVSQTLRVLKPINANTVAGAYVRHAGTGDIVQVTIQGGGAANNTILELSAGSCFLYFTQGAANPAAVTLSTANQGLSVLSANTIGNTFQPVEVLIAV